MSLKIIKPHAFEFKLVFRQGEEETTVSYYPNDGIFSNPGFGYVYSFSDVITHLNIEGEYTHIEELFTSIVKGDQTETSYPFVVCCYDY